LTYSKENFTVVDLAERLGLEGKAKEFESYYFGTGKELIYQVYRA